MTTKAQIHFNKILSEIKLDQITNLESFNVIPKGKLKYNKHPTYPGSYGGIEVKVHNETKTDTLVFALYGDSKIGLYSKNRFYEIQSITQMVGFINNPI